MLLTHIAMSHELQRGTKRTAVHELPLAQQIRVATAVETPSYQQQQQQWQRIQMQPLQVSPQQQQQQQQQQHEEQEDNTYKNLVLQYRDGSHISGELDVEEHIVYFKELTGYIKQQQQQHTNLNDTEWERECRFSVRSVVHTVTAILVEFESNHMGFEVFKVLSTKGYICDSKEMQVMLGRDFFVQPTIEQQQQQDERTMVLHLRKIPSMADVPSYTKAIAEHYKLTIDELQIAILTTEILGEKTDNQDGTVRYVFVNKHNVKTYPVLDMLFHGKKVGIMSAARYMISIKGVTLCPDMNCAAIGDAHKMGCKAQQIEKQRTINRSHAVGKSFESILAGNRTRANEIRLAFKKVAKEKTLTYCLKYNAKGVPCADGRCRYYPCCDWLELNEVEESEGGLKGTFYEGMPDCMKPKVKTKRPLDNITFSKNIRSKGECHRSQCEMGCNCGD